MKNRHKYPDNWFSEIRPKTLVRYNFRCMDCGVQNGKLYYFVDGVPFQVRTAEEKAEAVEWGHKVRVMGLQVCHLNQDTTDNSDANLGLKCPSCHFRFDNMYNSFKRRQRRSK